MSAPLFMNVWQGAPSGHQWTDSPSIALMSRELCDEVARDLHSKPHLGIRRVALIRVHLKQECTA